MSDTTIDLPLQPVSQEVYEKKYQLRNKDNDLIDVNVAATFRRVSKALASVEIKNQEMWQQKFYEAMVNGAIPAGRIISNLGAEEYKPEASTINCTVSGTIEDSMESILERIYEAGLTLKAGCGIGYEFSTLRPKGALVKGVGATTSGPLPFMDVYDKLCSTISSAGGRRGAQMATFDIGHPDILDFIKAKREDGRFRQFNVSVLVTDAFLLALKNDDDWHFLFPVHEKEAAVTDNAKLVWIDWHDKSSKHTYNEEGECLCKIYKTLPARDVWDVIMKSAYDYSEPGILLIDEINYWNNTWWCEEIRATNPCGEQPLPPYGACLLGSINLTKFVRKPFTKDALFDYALFKKTVKVFTRMLDNVVEKNGLPLEEQQQEILRKRRHGMGITGLGSALTMLQVVYGSEEAILWTDNIMASLAISGWEEGVELAKEKGSAPIMDESFDVTDEMFKNGSFANAGHKVGNKVSGKELFIHSNYIQRIAKYLPGLIKELSKHGCRFTHHTSIAPTGTISLALCNNVSNGIEPSFSQKYNRNLTVEGKKTRQQMEVNSYELLAYKSLIDNKADPEKADLPHYFIEADNIEPSKHVDMQAAAQKWVDSSISKTINLPTDIEFENFKSVYRYGAEQHLKGATVFRYNPETLQGILVKNEELENTLYKFTLEDGSEVEVKGSEDIEYEGEVHNAAMLFDAIKEGRYTQGY